MLAGKARPLCQPLRRRPPEHVHLPGQGGEPGTPASQFPLSFWDPSGTQPGWVLYFSGGSVAPPGSLGSPSTQVSLNP